MIEKNVSLHVSPKNCFLEPNLIQKPTKKQNCHQKKMCWVFFSYKNLTSWFLRAYFEISAHTDGPNLFSIMNCFFAKNWNRVLSASFFIFILINTNSTFKKTVTIIFLFHFFFLSLIIFYLKKTFLTQICWCRNFC